MITGLPIFDWQFIVVTIAFVASALMMWRRLMPKRSSSSGPSCPGCGSATSRRRPRRVRTSLTIDGKSH